MVKSREEAANEFHHRICNRERMPAIRRFLWWLLEQDMWVRYYFAGVDNYKFERELIEESKLNG